MYLKGGPLLSVVALENQANVHYAMPVRSMLYDALDYTDQVQNLQRAHQEQEDSLDSSEFLSGIRREDRLIPDVYKRQHEPLTRRDLDRICAAYGYRESGLTIVPKLTGGEWALLTADPDGTFRPVLSHPDRLKPPLTALQKSWLKSLLADPRIRLFLTDEALTQLTEALQGVEALYDPEDLRYFDRSLDGDDYESPLYRRNFAVVLNCLRQGRTMKLVYQSPKRCV